MSHELFFTQLVVAKVCHDLATPLNALSLGLEMGDGGAFSKDTLDLIQESAESMKSRLKLFRSLLSSSESSPTLEDLKDIFSQCAKISKVAVIWSVSPNLIESPVGTPLRLLLALCFIALEGLPRGGSITILVENPSEFLVKAEGSMAQLRPGYQDILLSNPSLDDQTSRSILPFYSRLLAHLCESQIFCECGVGNFEIGVRAA
jgi:histidine phosphotransferase ChpT